jgi:hypothetical protein
MNGQTRQARNGPHRVQQLDNEETGLTAKPAIKPTKLRMLNAIPKEH